MASLTIVSGAPGAGKTTVSRELAQRAPKGVHIVSDEFYFYIVDLIAPSSPESRDQNMTVITAVMRAAVTFASGTYDVFVDGVFGKWFLPLVARELERAELPVDYVLLTASLEDSLDRVGERDAPGIEDVVRKMHGHFADVEGLERHIVDTHDRTLEQTIDDVIRRQAAGDFRLDLDAYA